MKAPELTVANGYECGRPADRLEKALDRTVEKAVYKIPAATRLFPDVYSWRVTDAVEQALERETTRRLATPEWSPLSEEELLEVFAQAEGSLAARLRTVARSAVRAHSPLS